MTKRGGSNNIRKQTVKVPNGGQKKGRQPNNLKSKVKTILIGFYDAEGITHHIFVSVGTKVSAPFYPGFLRRLLHHIRRIRPEYREEGRWSLLQGNAPSHRSTF